MTMPQENGLEKALVAQMANILSLDQSSHTVGYAIWQDSSLIKASHFDAKGTTLAKRLFDIKQQILKLIKENNIDKVIFEDIQLQSNIVQNVKTFKMLAEVYGTLELTLTEINMPYEIVAPNVWKANIKVAGKGRTKEKALTQQWVQNTYGFTCTEDEADSVGIGAYFFNQQNSFDWS